MKTNGFLFFATLATSIIIQSNTYATGMVFQCTMHDQNTTWLGFLENNNNTVEFWRGNHKLFQLERVSSKTEWDNSSNMEEKDFIKLTWDAYLHPYEGRLTITHANLTKVYNCPVGF